MKSFQRQISCWGCLSIGLFLSCLPIRHNSDQHQAKPTESTLNTAKSGGKENRTEDGGLKGSADNVSADAVPRFSIKGDFPLSPEFMTDRPPEPRIETLMTGSHLEKNGSLELLFLIKRRRKNTGRAWHGTVRCPIWTGRGTNHCSA
jgi:hypothetical protein